MTWTPRECALHDFNAAMAADEPIRRTLGWDSVDYQAAFDGRVLLRAAAWRTLARTVEAAKATPRTLHKEPDDASLDAMAARAAERLAALEPVETASADIPVETAAEPAGRRWSIMR